MAIVSISLDTTTRQAILTVNGVLVPSDEFHISKYLMYNCDDDDGELEISFGYTIENVDSNGLKERRHFYLPSPEEIATEAHSELNEDGFASKAVRDDKKVKADMINYFEQNR